jgi:hypothetical protein
MRTYTKNQRRAQLRVESLEGKTLLSAGSLIHQAVAHERAAPIVAQAAAAFSGTLTGTYSNIHIPFAGYLLNYATSGTLTGIGSANLHGSMFARPRAGLNRATGQFAVRNSGGSMTVNVVETATPGTYNYRVVRARGSDTAFKGGTGELLITQVPTYNAPYYVSGQVTMNFASA